MRTRWRIRSHLIILVLATAIPLSSLLIFTAYSTSAQDAQQAGAETLRLAQLTADRIEQTLDYAAQSAALITHQSIIGPGSLITCGPILNDVYELHPYFTDVAVVNRAGDVVCSVVQVTEGKVISVASAALFQDVVRANKSVVGKVEVGPITGQWVVVLGYPIHDDQQQLIGVLALPLDLVHFNQTFSDVEMPDGSAVTVVDAVGTVIARSPDPLKWVGQNISSMELISSTPTQPEGVIQGHGVDGVERLYGYTGIRGTNWHVYIGIPTDVVFASVRANFVRNIVLGLASGLLVVVFTLAISRRITVPIQAIADAARAVSQGRLETRTPVEGPVELAQVAQAFNTMLDIRMTEEQTLRDNQRFIERMTRAIPDVLYIFDLTTQQNIFSDTEAVNLLGYSAEQLTTLGSAFLFQLMHPDDIPRFAQRLQYYLTAQEGKVFELEYRMKHADGSWHWFNSRDTVFTRDANGAPRQIIGAARDITVRKRAEEALRQSEERFRRLAENAQDVIYRVRLLPTFGFEYVSPASEALCGLTPDDLYADFSLAIKLLHPDDISQFEMIRTDKAQTHISSFRIFRSDGSLRWVEQRHVLVRDKYGQVAAIEGIVRDVTERRQTDEALRNSEALFHDLADNAPGPIWLTDADNQCTYVSKRWIEFTGQTLDEARGVGWTACIHSDDRESCWTTYEAAFNARQPVQLEYRLCRADGEYCWMIDNGVPHFSADGKIFLGYIGAIIDITERKQAEEALRKSEAAEHEQRILSEALRDSAAMLAKTLEPETVMVQILENARRVVPHDAANIILIEDGMAYIAYWQGYSPASAAFLKEICVAPETVPDLQPMMQPDVRYHISPEQTTPGKENGVHPSLHWIRSHLGAPIRAHGLLIGFIHLDSAAPNFFTPYHGEQLSVFADQAAIAIENARLYDELRRKAHELERRVAERTVELYRAKEHIEAIFNNTGDAVVVAQVDGSIRQTNPAFNDAFNYPADTMIGQSLTRLTEPESSAALLESLHKVVVSRQAQRMEIIARRSDGHVFDADVALAPILEQNEQTTGVVCSVRDISSRKRLENELRRAAERERELNDLKSRFVSMVSHEFRTPLATIQTSSDLLGRYSHRLSDSQKLERLHLIQTQVQHMTKLLEDVLTIGLAEARQVTFRPAPHNPEAFYRELIDLMQVTAETHHFIFSSEGCCPTFIIDQELLQHALLNLLSNAVKYSPSGSAIYCDLLCQPDQVIFRVRDEGIGVPADDLPYIFDAFRRGTNTGQISGTGLGLAIVKQAVDQHGGSITVQSEVGVGTIFTITLPVKEQSASSAPRAEQTPPQ